MHQHRVIRTGRLLASLVFLLAAVAARSQAAEPATPTTHALLINGGARASSNYQSHLHHLQDLVEALRLRGIPAERIHIFSADGDEDGADLAGRDAAPEAYSLLAGTRVGRRLHPPIHLTNTQWPGMSLQPARKQSLERWFEETGSRLGAGDRLLLFVTDHGTPHPKDPDGNRISLWGEELSVAELRRLLARLPAGVQVVEVMSQCYSGDFADTMFSEGTENDAIPSGAVCGFYSAAPDRPAYGCYPEGRDRDRLGYASRFIEALSRRATVAEAHRELLVTDDTPDTPRRTSDVYLEGLLERRAQRDRSTFEALVDALLAQAWENRAAWEEEIRLLDRLGQAFGTTSPRSLAEVAQRERDFGQLAKEAGVYAERWEAASVAVKEENLGSFVAAEGAWKERLEPAALEALDDSGREALLVELLPALDLYLRARPDVGRRVEDLAGRAERASQARWRFDVRAAVLDRMRRVLIGIAGRTLLRTTEPPSPQKASVQPHDLAVERQAFERLAACEELAPGLLPDSRLATTPPAVPDLPSLAEERKLLVELLPSWLGVRYGAVPESLRADRDLPPGATALLAVYPDSPATAAGLEAGDIVIGTPERTFATTDALREWTMLSPRDVPLTLRVIRPAVAATADLELQPKIELRPFPTEMPELPDPPRVGETAPRLPESLQALGEEGLPDLAGRPRLLFFWATWCQPCKRATPEVLAFASARNLTALAITDEPAADVERFLEHRHEPFFEHVAVDPLRKAVTAYSVSGTPTILVIDEKNVVQHVQVGYGGAEGLKVPGWSWTAPEPLAPTPPVDAAAP